MQVKKGIVESVQSNGSWQNKEKTRLFYAFEVSFTNGDVGVYSSINKDQNKFEVGAEVEYEFTDGKFPKVKPHYSKPPGSFQSKSSYGKSDDVQVKIVRQSMLKASIDFWAISPELKPSTEDIFKTANIFIDFVNQKAEPQFSNEFTKLNTGIETKTITRKEARNKVADEMENFAEQSGQSMYPSQEDDLPF